MTTATKCAISPFGQPQTEPHANSIHFFNETLASVPASSIPESAIHGETDRKRLGPNKSLRGVAETGNVRVPLDAAKAWLRNSSPTDTFEFGGVTGCFSTIEVHRDGQPVTLTAREFKILEYLIHDPRRVISRDELLNEVWGYKNYPCTRTVDQFILRLSKKLEPEPEHPKQFQTVFWTGYKFLP